ncbi:MAG TPA: carbonic anhydrase [Chloroflexota bacterium]|nr:carbonic anhydrase [Chloroflexota bacterium]
MLVDPDADMALATLMEGNRRYVASLPVHPGRSPEHRVEVAQAQRPFAAILGCADSRVPAEIVFDQGIGDLFVVRVAGNVVDDAVLGSIEYAVLELRVPLVLVLGHGRCGAVKAAIDIAAGSGQPPGRLPVLVEAIQPAIERVKGRLGDLLDNSVRANVRLIADHLRTTEPILAPSVRADQVKIVGARYDLDTGEVEILERNR